MLDFETTARMSHFERLAAHIPHLILMVAFVNGLLYNN